MINLCTTCVRLHVFLCFSCIIRKVLLIPTNSMSLFWAPCNYHMNIDYKLASIHKHTLWNGQVLDPAAPHRLVSLLPALLFLIVCLFVEYFLFPIYFSSTYCGTVLVSNGTVLMTGPKSGGGQSMAMVESITETGKALPLTLPPPSSSTTPPPPPLSLILS